MEGHEIIIIPLSKRSVPSTVNSNLVLRVPESDYQGCLVA
jgi:hypothetical protein